MRPKRAVVYHYEVQGQILLNFAMRADLDLIIEQGSGLKRVEIISALEFSFGGSLSNLRLSFRRAHPDAVAIDCF